MDDRVALGGAASIGIVEEVVLVLRGTDADEPLVEDVDVERPANISNGFDEPEDDVELAFGAAGPKPNISRSDVAAVAVVVAGGVDFVCRPLKISKSLLADEEDGFFEVTLPFPRLIPPGPANAKGPKSGNGVSPNSIEPAASESVDDDEGDFDAEVGVGPKSRPGRRVIPAFGSTVVVVGFNGGEVVTAATGGFETGLGTFVEIGVTAGEMAT